MERNPRGRGLCDEDRIDGQTRVHKERRSEVTDEHDHMLDLTDHQDDHW
jgi:hypothetical protein